MNAYRPPVPARPRASRVAGVGRDSTWMPSAGDLLHLALVPVAGVGEHHLRVVGDSGRVQFALGGVEHRFEVPEVG